MKVQKINYTKTNFEMNFNRYIQKYTTQYYNQDNLINKGNIDDLICPICFFILKDPVSCSEKNNAHSFCKHCITKFLSNNNKCPICKLTFEYKSNNQLKNILNKLLFKCVFNNVGCNNILSYSEYINHVNNCIFNTRYECNTRRYNYKNKEFEKCGYSGNKIKIDNHFKSCGGSTFKCLFCKENMYQTNIEEHMKNKCKFGIIIGPEYPYKFIYIGEKLNKIKHGYGIFYNNNGYRYEGEFKNNIKEGYGRVLYDDGEKYDSEFKNNTLNGYCILYKSNGDKYEGQIKNNKTEGIGIYYFSNGTRYEGEFKNGNNEGFGIVYYPDGKRFEGEFKNGSNNGFGITYFPNGDRYESNFIDGKDVGDFVFHSRFGFKYHGNHNHPILLKILIFCYKILLFINSFNSLSKWNQIILLLIIILIIAFFMNK